MCRAFGDLGYAPKLTVDPHTSTTALGADDQFLILACDGVWDVLSDQESVDLVGGLCCRGGTAEMACQRLRDEALQRGSGDNISVMVVLLQVLRTAHGHVQ